MTLGGGAGGGRVAADEFLNQNPEGCPEGSGTLRDHKRRLRFSLV